ncbi:MAG: hypothetical protein K2H01_03945 [Ruminococcus sp.]|nr:hypothetical protein [Ruminococcus sp.]
MTNIKDTIINPADFLAMYQKIQRLNPLTYERVCGIIDGICIREDISINSFEQEKGELTNEE